MKSEQIKHSLSVGTKSIQSRVYDRETDEVISFVKIPIKDSGLVRCEKGTREMNNEPVAYVDNVWINRPDLAMDLGIGQMFSRCQLSDHQIPLYTHPVKEQLTDGEINLLAKAYSTMEGELNAPAFARAILRRAQEK